MTAICDTCGEAYGIGQWWKCPHDPVSHGRGADVTWPGGRTFENLGHEPQTFYSPSEQRAYLKAHNLEPFVRHQPVPGSDKSPHTVSWSSVSRTTLEGAQAMLARMARDQQAKAESYVASMTVTVTDAVESVRGERGVFGSRRRVAPATTEAVCADHG